MTPLLSEQAQQRQVEFEARGTSGSALAKTTALSVLLLFSQPGPALAAVTERRFWRTGTIGTGAEILSLMITEADLFGQISRVYDELLRDQLELDLDVRRVLYGELWSLYS
jgi:hypothetical protein